MSDEATLLSLLTAQQKQLTQLTELSNALLKCVSLLSERVVFLEQRTGLHV